MSGSNRLARCAGRSGGVRHPGAALLLVTVPLTDFSSEPAWHRVGWIPFQSPRIKAADILANTVLYVPLGILWPGDRSRIRSFFYAIAAGAALSMIGETTEGQSVAISGADRCGVQCDGNRARDLGPCY